jgi:transposase InsO family protein
VREDVIKVTAKYSYRSPFTLLSDRGSMSENADYNSYFRVARQIGIGAAVTRRPLPHHRAYGSVHGGSSWLR